MGRPQKILPNWSAYVFHKFGFSIWIQGPPRPATCKLSIKYAWKLNKEHRAWEEKQWKARCGRDEALAALHAQRPPPLPLCPENESNVPAEGQVFGASPFATNLLAAAHFQQHTPAAHNNVQYAPQQLTQAHQELQGVFTPAPYAQPNGPTGNTNLSGGHRAAEGLVYEDNVAKASYQGGRVPSAPRSKKRDAAYPYSRDQGVSIGGARLPVRGPSASSSHQPKQHLIHPALHQHDHRQGPAPRPPVTQHLLCFGNDELFIDDGLYQEIMSLPNVRPQQQRQAAVRQATYPLQIAPTRTPHHSQSAQGEIPSPVDTRFGPYSPDVVSPATTLGRAYSTTPPTAFDSTRTSFFGDFNVAPKGDFDIVQGAMAVPANFPLFPIAPPQGEEHLLGHAMAPKMDQASFYEALALFETGPSVQVGSAPELRAGEGLFTATQPQQMSGRYHRH